MLNLFIHKAKNFLREKPARNNLTVFDDDVFLVSYPRSGNTWARFLLGNLVYEEPITWDNIDYKIPGIYRVSNTELLKCQRPRILKSHHSYDPRYPKVIYLVRDVRDVCISYYYFRMKYLKKKLNFNEYLQEFVNGNLDDFGTYSQNYKSWTRMKDEIWGGFLLLKYEDLKANTYLNLKRISNFIGIKPTEEKIYTAIEKSDFNAMKKAEIESAGKSSLFIESDKSINFVRKAKPGEWKEVLTIEQNNLLLDNFGDVLNELGYNTGILPDNKNAAKYLGFSEK